MGRDTLTFDYYLSLAHLYDTTDLNMPSSSAQRNGAVAESKFITECLQRNFEPHMPVTPMPWDFIVTCPAGCLKVQIKSTQNLATPSTYQIVTKTGNDKTNAMSMDLEVVGCYVASIDTWWLIPREDIQGLTVRLNPDKDSKSKYKKYQENWSIFYE